MSTPLKISAQPRTAVGRGAVKKIKSAGLVPATIYGTKQPPRNLQMREQDVKALLSHAASESVLVEVEIQETNGAPTRSSAMLQEVQHNPVSGRVLHLDLHAVSLDELISAEVPVESRGEATGVKLGGGVLQQSLRTLEIECLPTDLPEVIAIDVSGLVVGASLHVRDLALPRGVTALNDPDLTVFAVTEPTVVPEPTTTAATAAATPPATAAAAPAATDNAAKAS